METLYHDDDDDEDDDVDSVAADGFDSNHSPTPVSQFATGFPPINLSSRDNGNRESAVAQTSKTDWRRRHGQLGHITTTAKPTTCDKITDAQNLGLKLISIPMPKVPGHGM
ncbi:GM16038 [Drosophila sechellia]|uniref:GM16038 n=1 Tax=Drosophila sechellia TaxID=7238 RepID=B4HXP4_DROSE|nr:GM16038 [Drosophila sechellia]